MNQHSPLADRARPSTLAEVLGHEKAIGKAAWLLQSLAKGHLPSLIFWGPPGSGKTTIARLLAQEIKSEFMTLQAVTAGLKEFRESINRALENKMFEKRTVLFIDEIHRWNKKQQDALLPYVENGTVVFIGATTENPSFEVISALLSRVKVIVLDPLPKDTVIEILKKAATEDAIVRELKIALSDAEIERIAEFSGGDARVALNAFEAVVHTLSGGRWEHTALDLIKHVFDKTQLLYDKDGEEHYNVISAFIKSLRGSDADAAVYYLARMIEGGEDPEFIARRMLAFASEDIGNALPTALVVVNACFDAVRKIGWPESRLILSQTALYLAKAPKSNMAIRAISAAQEEVRKSGSLPVPLHLRNAPTGFMKDLGYGDGYVYSHDDPERPQDFLPEQLRGRKFVDSDLKE